MPIEVMAGFTLIVLAMMASDVWIFSHKSRDPKFREALLWTLLWVGVAFLFNLAVYHYLGRHAAMQFLAGYLIEQSLSVDNLFVFILIFSHFHIPRKYQRKILIWGILGAIVMRAIFISSGIALIQRFHWMTYLLGALLVITGIRMGFESEKKIEPEKGWVLRFCRKFLPMLDNDDKGSLIVRKKMGLYATPLFIVLVVVETTDVIFAIDSIPAIFAITLNPFIVFTSNIFAVLGLRSLYFLLSGAMQTFHHLNIGLAVILSFVGVKMLLADIYAMPITGSLGFIVIALVISIAASIIWPEVKDEELE